MIKKLLSRWPLIQQIRNRSDGTGIDAMTERTRHLKPRNSDAQVAPRASEEQDGEVLVPADKKSSDAVCRQVPFNNHLPGSRVRSCLQRQPANCDSFGSRISIIRLELGESSPHSRKQ